MSNDTRTLLFVDTAANRTWTREPTLSSRQPYLVRLTAHLTRGYPESELSGQWLAILVELPINEQIEQSGYALHGITTEDISEINTPRIVHPRIAIQRFAALSQRADLLVGHAIDLHMRLLRRTAEITDSRLFMPADFCTMRRSANMVQAPRTDGKNGIKWPKLTEAYRHFAKRDIDLTSADPLVRGRTIVKAVERVFLGITEANP